MEVVRSIGRIIRDVGFYLFGRGLVSLAIIAATSIAMATGAGFVLPALVVAVGGTLFKIAGRAREQQRYEQDMLRIYRDDLAAAFGIPARAVTREHLYAAAKENGIIAQALKRQQRESMVETVTSIAAGLVTFGLLYVGLAHTQLAEFFVEKFGNVLGNILGAFSVGMVAGTTSLIVHDGLGEIIDARAGLNKASAHDAIAKLAMQVAQRKPVTPDQVFGVVVANDAQLAKQIRQQFRREYTMLAAPERWKAMNDYGVTASMITLADAMNQRSMRPSQLAFILDGAPMRRSAVAADAAADTLPARASFVARYADTPRAQQSFVERVNASRALAADQGRSN